MHSVRSTRAGDEQARRVAEPPGEIKVQGKVTHWSSSQMLAVIISSARLRDKRNCVFSSSLLLLFILTFRVFRRSEAGRVASQDAEERTNDEPGLRSCWMLIACACKRQAGQDRRKSPGCFGKAAAGPCAHLAPVATRDLITSSPSSHDLRLPSATLQSLSSDHQQVSESDHTNQATQLRCV